MMFAAALLAARGLYMMAQMKSGLAIVATAFALVGVWAGPAQAGDNDLVLSRFGNFVHGDPSCTHTCGWAEADTQGFRDLTRELGQVFGPRFAAPSDTLGEAGFALSLMTSFSFIDNEADYWRKAVQNRAPSSTMFTGHLQIRKGLPFSFEIGSDLSYLFASEMFDLGAQLKWALNEGFYYFPDVAVRGTVNTLLGSRDLNLYTAGWDISISKAFPVKKVLTLTPYIGYQQLYVIGSSRVLNAFPQDPRPPQIDQTGVAPDESFTPEFVFESHTQTVNRAFLGTRLKVWVLHFTLEGIYSKDMLQATIAGGMDF